MALTPNSLRWSFGVAFAIFACFLCFWVFKSISHPPHDFANSYFGAQFLIDGQFDSTIYDPYIFNKKIFDVGYKHVFVSFSPNPPSAAVLFIPLTIFSLPTAKLIFSLLTCGLFAASAYRLAKHLNLDSWIMFIWLPILFFTPIRNQILFGQTYFLLLALLIEGYLAYHAGKSILTSVLFSLAIILKVFPAIVVLFFILKKDWRQAASLCITLLVLFFLTLILVEFNVWKYYVQTILPRSSAGEITSGFVVSYQSAFMFLKYLFVSDPTLNPEPLFSSTFLFELAWTIFRMIIIGCCVFLIYVRKDFLAFAMMIFSSLLISPYGSTYSSILLLLLFFAIEHDFKTPFKPIFYVLIFLSANIPLAFFKDYPLLLQFPRLISMVLLFGCVMIAMRPAIKWRWVSIATVLTSAFVYLNHNDKTGNSQYLLKQDLHSIIFDYDTTDQHLSYKYWSEQGEMVHLTDVEVIHFDKKDATIKNNQIWYKGESLTDTGDQKSNATILNNECIVFLSDQDRGPGFYTIRMIPLPKN